MSTQRDAGPSAQDGRLREAVAELERRLAAGEADPAAAMLRERPDLAADRNAALELLYTEYVLREERGERPEPREWCDRFPDFRDDLLGLFEVHRAVHAETVGERDRWATLGSAETTDPAAPGVWGRVGGYEVLGELGRGAMGVVYKARQEGLKRLVALKMILGGRHAGAATLARFRREAEAVARLQHPNIVQVFEAGEHDGLPFLAMELVVGGSLERRL